MTGVPSENVLTERAGARVAPTNSFARLAGEASRRVTTLPTGLHTDYAETLKQTHTELHENLAQSLIQMLKGTDTDLLTTLKKFEASSAAAGLAERFSAASISNRTLRPLPFSS